jgi:hypothetical protein
LWITAMVDPMTALAFSVYSSKGVFALLLGSGISRSSGIPTGWEIVLDLIKKIAAIEGKECGDDPAAWYMENHKKDPSYTELLELSARTSAERMELLRGYFEPTEAEREASQKVPTRAHHAIARLVADGYIRVIVTTNFDRLMEMALESAGVVPSVIASADSILGAVPLTHSKCTLIKVHGDYRDTRLKNTPDEVGTYDQAMNRLLDQVFDEYGLIVSGWSAEWDAALRAAIERCPSRRYTTYWSAFGGLTDAAARLCQHRGAQVVQGMGADEFFDKLSEKVAAVEAMNSPHPLTARMAVATLKRYLPEARYRIRLHDLMLEEAGKVATAFFSDLGNSRRRPTLDDYEARMETLLHLLAAAGYWGRPEHRSLWLRCFHQLVTPRSGSLPGLAENLDFYPAYLALHAFGIGAIAGGRQGNLAYVLAKGRAHVADKELSLLRALIVMLRSRALQNAVERDDVSFRGRKLPVDQYLHGKMRGILNEWIPEQGRYDALFRRFEYIVSLVTAELYGHSSQGACGASNGLYLDSPDLQVEVQAEVEKAKEKWPYFRAGLFEGSLTRFLQVKAGHDESANNLRRELRL